MLLDGEITFLFVVFCHLLTFFRSLPISAINQSSAAVCSVAAGAARGFPRPSAAGPQGNARQRAESNHSTEMFDSQHSQLRRDYSPAMEQSTGVLVINFWAAG